MKKFTLFIVLFIFLQMLNSMESPPPSYYKSEQLLGQLQKNYANEIKKYNLSACGSGGSTDINGTITLVSISFNRFGPPLSKNDGRALVINCVEKYLDLINNNQEIRPFLGNFPFTFKNLELSIFCYNALNFI